MSKKERLGTADEIREHVREGYSRVAERASSCCGTAPRETDELGRRLGYSDEELEAAPEGANLGLGCGNPTALAELRAGEAVLDLGSGAGFDAFLAARAVGAHGRVIGVDMTDAMLDRARANARQGGFENVEFRHGTIESLPVETASVDVVLSNCVINLSPEKEQVFREAFRVLRPGGRLLVSDLVLERPLPPKILESVEAYVGCVGGAALRPVYLEAIAKAGFAAIEIAHESRFGETLSPEDPIVSQAIEAAGITFEQARGVAASITSLAIGARKPAA